MTGDQLIGVSAMGLVDAKLTELRTLCRRFGVRRLDLFGSAATGRFDPARSDLDFLVAFAPAGSGPSDTAKRDMRFLDELVKLFGCEVDLIDEADLQNPYLRR